MSEGMISRMEMGEAINRGGWVSLRLADKSIATNSAAKVLHVVTGGFTRVLTAMLHQHLHQHQDRPNDITRGP